MSYWERMGLSLQLQELPTQGWSGQRTTVSSDQRDKRTRIWTPCCRKAMDNTQGCIMTGTASPAPRNASTMPAWPALSSHQKNSPCCFKCAYIHAHTYIHKYYLYI